MPEEFPATAILLIIAGVWLALQTIVGDLPGRLLSRAATASAGASSSSIGGIVGGLAKNGSPDAARGLLDPFGIGHAIGGKVGIDLP